MAKSSNQKMKLLYLMKIMLEKTDEEINFKVYGGDGTVNNPYQIANGAQLYKMVAEYSNAKPQEI